MNKQRVSTLAYVQVLVDLPDTILLRFQSDRNDTVEIELTPGQSRALRRELAQALKATDAEVTAA